MPDSQLGTQRRRTGPQDLAGDPVRVDDPPPALRKSGGDHRLTGPDPSGQPHPQHRAMVTLAYTPPESFSRSAASCSSLASEPSLALLLGAGASAASEE
jgi:hypothetical protein